MVRLKYQVLVLPYLISGTGPRYCIFERKNPKFWQFISGGGEDFDGSILESAKREAFEEAGISPNEKYTALETQGCVSTQAYKASRKIWGPECLVLPEYFFAVELNNDKIVLSGEHFSYKWVDYNTAKKLLKADSNKVALWELKSKIRQNRI